MKAPLLLLALIMCGFIILAFSMYGPPSPAQAQQDISVEITAAASLDSVSQAENACYKAAEQMKAAGLVSEKQTLKKENIPILPNDLIYDTYASENGTKCALLNRKESRFADQGQGVPLIAGCICTLVVPIN